MVPYVPYYRALFYRSLIIGALNYRTPFIIESLIIGSLVIAALCKPYYSVSDCRGPYYRDPYY